MFIIGETDILSNNMGNKTEIDDIDAKILGALIRDARTRLKDIAKDCDLSSVAVLNRINNLKARGVIVGATLFPDLEKAGGLIAVTLGINVDSNKEEDVIKLIREQTCLIEPSTSLGKYDFCALVFVKDLRDLDKVTQSLKKQLGVTSVIANIWVPEPFQTYENLNLQPKRTG
jgi:DNA-binding Lrp family transcriptional regulator